MEVLQGSSVALAITNPKQIAEPNLTWT